MKIAVCSDLHLEFQDLELKNTEGADVLILSGDIMIAEDLHNHKDLTSFAINDLGKRQATALRFRNFLKRCSEEFPHVIYVAGNHEFYHGRWKASIDHLREECSNFPNIYFLERDTKEIGDVTFIGGTVWTDCNRADPITLHALADMMNDYKIIRNDERDYAKLRPIDTLGRHRDTISYFKAVLPNLKDNKVVVVGHHSPCKLSTHPRYKNDVIMNGGYSSDLTEFILDNPQIKLWTHGHTHDPFDYMIGETRIFCNPRGYAGWDEMAEHFQLRTVEV